MKTLKILGALLLALSFLAGCAGDDDKKKPAELRAVNGDPWVYVKSTNNNGDYSELPADLFDDNASQQWDLNYYGFREQSLNGYQGSQEHFLKGSRELYGIANQDVTDEGVTLSYSGSTLLKLKKSATGSWIVDSSQEVLFHNEKQKVVHYSYTPDKNTFSILFYMTSDDGLKALISLAATKIKTNIIPDKNNDSYYSYVADDILTRWKQSTDGNQLDNVITFDKCFMPYDGLSDAIDLSYKAWTDALTDRLSTTIESKSTCPPFSDLNTHTIQYIDDWIELNGPSGVMGGVWNRYFVTTGEIVDADMFIYKSELAQYLAATKPGTDMNKPETYKNNSVLLYLRWVITHEFGHMLGLDHKMSGPRSVMSYDNDYFYGSIFSYDRNAIANLYPLKTRRWSVTDKKQK